MSIASLKFLASLTDMNLSSAVCSTTKLVIFLRLKMPHKPDMLPVILVSTIPFGIVSSEIYMLLYSNLPLEVTVVNPNIIISVMVIELVFLQHNFHYQI